VNSKNFDFNARLAAIRENEAQEKAIRKEERKRKRAERREAEGLGRLGLEANAGAGEKEGREREIQGIEDMMGFGRFSSRKK
jgi:U4/U6.U5 tri-snRNP component SNU23